MSEKSAVLHVRVVSATGTENAPKGRDRITLSGTPMAYKADDGFVQEITGKGDALLKVEYDGFEPLEQTFHFEAPAERPKFIPFWPGTEEDPTAKGARDNYLLACMDLTRAAGGIDGARSPQVFNLTVTLLPTAKYFAVIGCDYWEDAEGPGAHHRSLDFDRYAMTYASHLTATNTLNICSPFVAADCQRGRIERWHRIRGSGATTVWKRHSQILKRDPCPRWASGKEYAKWLEDITADGSKAAAYLGAPDIYWHLSELGDKQPGQIVDFSIFSHAWHGGPILFDTFADPDRAHPSIDRFPGDLDMRFTKDFVSPNVDGWPSIPAAFATGGTIHVWGCFATDSFNKMVRFLLGEGGTNGRFKDDGLSLDRNGVIQTLKGAITKQSFMSRIAKFTGKNTFGGLPGFGADNSEYGSIPTVPANLRSTIRGQLMHVPRITMESRFRKLFESADLDAQKFNEFGYMLYKP